MVETLHPGVYIIEAPAVPRISGIGTSTGSFIGAAKKGKTDEADLITSFDAFVTKYGSYYPGSYLAQAVQGFFNQLGGRCWISRVVGAGAAKADYEVLNSDEAPSAASVTGTINLSGGVDLRRTKSINLDIDAVGEVVIDLAAGAADPSAVSLTELKAAVNAAGFGVVATDDGANLIITSLTTGATSIVTIKSPTGAPALPAQIFGQSFDLGGIGVGNYAVDFYLDSAAGHYSQYFLSHLFVADPTLIFDATHYNMDFNIDGKGWQTVDITGDVGVGGSYAISLIVGNINTALQAAYADAFVYAYEFTGRDQIELRGDDQVQIRIGASNSATDLFLGFGLAALEELDSNYTSIPCDVTGQQGRGGYSLTQALVLENINRQLYFHPNMGSAYGSLDGTTGGCILNSVTSALDLVGVTLGGTGIAQLNDGPSGMSARLEVFGYPEGSGVVVQNGTVDDATLAVFGLSTGVTHTFTGGTGLDPFADVRALNEGDWGNNVTVTTQKYATTLVADVLSGATSAQLVDITNVDLGDIVRISDGTTVLYVHVIAITVGMSLIHFQSSVHLTVAAVTSAVTCATTHKQVSTTTAAYGIGDTNLVLNSASSINVGTYVFLDDGNNVLQNREVLAKSGSTIVVGALTAVLSSGAIVSTQNFTLTVKENGNLPPEGAIGNLSVWPNDADYYENRLFGDSNESSLIEMESKVVVAPPADNMFKIPLSILDAPLTGGLDGATPVTNDYIGSQAIPKSGIYLFDAVPEINMVSTPGITSVAVTKNGDAWCIANQASYISVTPLADEQPIEAKEYRQVELNIDSSHTSLYYPWIKISDPEAASSNVLMDMPPEGHLQGIWARVARDQGVWVSPSNVSISTALGLTYTVTDGEQDILNPIGVNCIRNFSDGSGITVWGTRTLSLTTDGTHYIPVRRLLDFVSTSLKIGLRFSVMKPNGPDLWRQVRDLVDSFLNGIWAGGGLVPPEDATRAYFVKCDAETNPKSVRDLGQVQLEVGVNPPFPSEFIVVKLGLWDGGSDVTEIIL